MGLPLEGEDVSLDIPDYSGVTLLSLAIENFDELVVGTLQA